MGVSLEEVMGNLRECQNHEWEIAFLSHKKEEVIFPVAEEILFRDSKTLNTGFDFGLNFMLETLEHPQQNLGKECVVWIGLEIFDGEWDAIILVQQLFQFVGFVFVVLVDIFFMSFVYL
jgi:hypothetical protein